MHGCWQRQPAQHWREMRRDANELGRSHCFLLLLLLFPQRRRRSQVIVITVGVAAAIAVTANR
jgi:hypothetical protein